VQIRRAANSSTLNSPGAFEETTLSRRRTKGVRITAANTAVNADASSINLPRSAQPGQSTPWQMLESASRALSGRRTRLALGNCSGRSPPIQALKLAKGDRFQITAAQSGRWIAPRSSGSVETTTASA